MTIPRVSVTHIEQYRLWRTGSWMSEADLIASIKGEFKPNRKILCGQAFHAILEAPDKAPQGCGSTGHWYEHNGIRFPGSIIDEALTHYERGGVPEVKATRMYEVGSQLVEVVAKVDNLRGLTIDETKTRWAAFDAEKYDASCQWRFYIDVFGANRVRYVVFQLDEDSEGGFELRGVHKLSMFPYPSLHSDCLRLLTEFMEYARMRELLPYLVARTVAE